ncbi:MAG: DUF2911 domain-containing protein [Cyclobacteriaceae bacterium]|jgi:hypothetical protein|nr:DUF2911 domain-containing protein [Flammeovirgaceae bacterium]
MRLLIACVFAVFIFSCQSKKTETLSKDSTATKPAKEEGAIIDEQSQADSLKGSVRARAFGTLGQAEIKMSYYSPAVRERIIWGGLVPFDKVWVTGAHSATSIEFNQTLIIGDKEVPAGKYAFFTIPGKKEWTIVINKNWRQHLTDSYDPKDDVVRVQVTPEIETKNQERLRYIIESQSATQGEVVVYWEKLKITLPIRVK